MYPLVFETLSAVASVTSVLGTAPVRLYPAGEAPQNVALPYATWQTVNGAPENYLGTLPDIDLWSVQIDVYSSTLTGARDAAQALRDAVEPVAHITRFGGEGRDPDTRHYRYSFDSDWWRDRETQSS